MLMTNSNTTIYDCLIIGAGAAGLMCAAALADHKLSAQAKTVSFSCLVLEGSKRVATKLLMSGGGQCNITHAGSIKDFVPCYGNNGKTIRNALFKHSNLEVITYLEKNGVPTVVRKEGGVFSTSMRDVLYPHTAGGKDGKVFPASMRGADIKDLFIQKAEAAGFVIRCGEKVTAVTTRPSGQDTSAEERSNTSTMPSGQGLSAVTPFDYSGAVRLKDGGAAAAASLCDKAYTVATQAGNTYAARHLVIATGGCSYPPTGSDGSMFDVLARDLQIKVIRPIPALTALAVTDYPFLELSGISFSDSTLTVTEASGKVLAKERGPILLTEKDFSGPAVLNISKYAFMGEQRKLRINYLSLPYEEVLSRLTARLSGSKGSLANLMADEFNLPKRFCQIMVARATGKAGSDPSPKAAARFLTEDAFLPMTDEATKTAAFKSAMATAGGVALIEINPKSFELRRWPGLYVIGEALDVDGATGGYNLQFAWSSAQSAADDIFS